MAMSSDGRGVGQEREYVFREEDTYGARGLIEGAWVLPDVGGPTLYGGFSFLTFVRLRDHEARDVTA